MKHTATIIRAGYEIRGTYHGGAYIDISFGSGPAFDVINVWNYTTDKPTIENTSAAIRQELVEWANEAGDSLSHDLREYAFSVRNGIPMILLIVHKRSGLARFIVASI